MEPIQIVRETSMNKSEFDAKRNATELGGNFNPPQQTSFV